MTTFRMARRRQLQAGRRRRALHTQLGDAEFRDVPAFISDSDDGIVAIDEAIGNVGGALFEGSVVAFDYSEESLWILPPSSASASGR